MTERSYNKHYYDNNSPKPKSTYYRHKRNERKRKLFLEDLREIPITLANSPKKSITNQDLECNFDFLNILLEENLESESNDDSFIQDIL